MLATMAKKLTDKAQDKPKDYHKDPRESFHMPPELKAAMLRYIDESRLKPGKSVVMRKALEEFLEREGYWPPKS